MSLLLLFSDQIAAAASGDVVTTMLVETTPGIWYDATSDLISGTTNRGRQDQLDQYQAGTADVLLDNDDRKYDPTYAASPLNGHILPRKRIQLRNTYAGVTYPMFTGRANRWTQNREGPHRGTTSLSATDGFSDLERTRLASSAYAQEVVADGPIHWWRFDEDGGTVAHDTVGDLDLAVTAGAPDLGTETLIARDPGASVTVTSADGMSVLGDLTNNGPPISVEMMVNVSAGTGTIFASIDESRNFGFALAADHTIGFQVAKGVGGSANAPSTVDYADGNPHHVVGTWDNSVTGASGAVRIYVDGVETTSGSPTLVQGGLLDIGYTFLGRHPLDLGGFVGTVDEVAVYDTLLSPARIAAHAAEVATPWDGDLTGARIVRVLDAAGWPDDLRYVDAGQTTLQAAELDMTALEHAQKVADTEAGNLYVTAAGVMRFEDRTSVVNQPVLFEFSDAAGTDLPVTFSNPEISDEQIRNDVTVSRLEGVAQNAKDATSIATYQISSYVRDGLYHDDDTHSRYLAQYILNGYKDPVERVSQMAVNPYRDPANLWPAVLGLELTDRITLEETPQWVTPAVTRTLVVEGITHSFAAKTWTASFNLSENTAATLAYWQLGIAGYSELGDTTRLYF